MFVSSNATQLAEDAAGRKKPKHALLWGDEVSDAVDAGDGKHVLGTAHGHRGLVAKRDLQTQPLELLELYVIDVGQGDAILFRTPDKAWHLMDGGPPKSKSLLGEGARSFLAWKFGADLALNTVPLHTVFLSHSDFDHFGGLTDILRSDFPPNPRTGQNPLSTTVEHFLHAGIAKYKTAGLGEMDKRIPAERLLDGRASFEHPPFELAKEYGAFAKAAVDVRNAAGGNPRIRRVTVNSSVPGYAPAANSPFSMRLLGPAPDPAGGLPWLQDSAHTVNGNSIVLRLDYDKVRVLLTGDINAVAQRHLLAHVDPGHFQADVIKACHHGAEDIDPSFTMAVGPRVTVVSSGDNETYSHPRPAALGGYAYYGRRSFMTQAESDTEAQPPLMYATEIARSIKTEALAVAGRSVTAIEQVIFGLVNVRTDGRKIVCAVRDEVNDSFDAEELWVGAEDAPPDDR
jgi:beta-lactamase superfamily II metal-dependent hydrolase